MLTLLKWIFRIVPVLVILVLAAGFVVVNKYPDYALTNGAPWIEFYRSQIVGCGMKIKDPGFWISMDRHIEKRTVKISREGKAFLDIFAVRFHPDDVVFKVLHFSPEEMPANSIGAVAERAGAVAVINGNFFDTAMKPLGLCVSDGKEITPLATSSEYEGIFAVTDKSVELIGSRSPSEKNQAKKSAWREAVQTRQRLVVGGKPQVQFADVRVTRRSAVAIDGKGRILLVATDTFFSGICLPDLAKVLGMPESEGGFGVKSALNLDGGTSTQLLVRTKDENLMVRGFVSVPTYIAVFEKNL